MRVDDETGGIVWAKMAYDLGLQGLAQEIAVNSVIETIDNDRLRLGIAPELLKLVHPSIEKEIQRAVELALGRPCRVEMVDRVGKPAETPTQTRAREFEARRQNAIEMIKKNQRVKKLQQAFDMELVESSVRLIED